MAIRTLLVANRGEIAVRIIRAAREMGIKTVQVYSSADAGSLAVQLADAAIEIGPPQAAKSYLNIDAILDAARAAAADAICVHSDTPNAVDVARVVRAAVKPYLEAA